MYTSLEKSKTELTGGFIGGQFGSVIKSGDFNGDNRSDIVVGAPFSSTSTKQWNGSLTLFVNTPSGQLGKFSFLGEHPGDQLGNSVVFGDFNDDGIDDLAIGAHYALTDETRKGKTYIVYGGDNNFLKSAYQSPIQSSENLTSHLASSVSNNANLVLTGQTDKSQFGLSLLSADINGDGIDDLIVGAPAYSHEGKKSGGAVYIYFGAKKGLGRNPNIVIYGERDNEKFGASLAVGDFDGNEKMDLAVGAYAANQDERTQPGKVYFYTDIASKSSQIYSADSSLSGYYEKSWFGFSLDAKDVNRNGADDLLVSSFPYLGTHRNSGVYLYYGGHNFFNKSIPDVIIDDFFEGSLPGATVLLEDFNGNGKKDIVIGSPGIEHLGGDFGKVYIVFNNQENLNRHYRIKNSLGINVIYGEQKDDWFGYSLDAFDFNADSILDLAVGARYFDTDVGVSNGKVFVFPGTNNPFGKISPLLGDSGAEVTRAELVKVIIDAFDLRNRKKDFLESCYEHKEFCFFNFTAMSSFNGISIEPELILYPDVFPNHKYYSYVNDATILGIVNGYLSADNSPFRPDTHVTKIQALKMILSASDLVPAKYKFELAEELGSYMALAKQFSYFSDINPLIDSMWWMPRYVNIAVEKGIIEKSKFFMPNEKISKDELNSWIIKTLLFLKSQNEEIES